MPPSSTGSFAALRANSSGFLRSSGFVALALSLPSFAYNSLCFASSLLAAHTLTRGCSTAFCKTHTQAKQLNTALPTDIATLVDNLCCSPSRTTPDDAKQQ